MSTVYTAHPTDKHRTSQKKRLDLLNIKTAWANKKIKKQSALGGIGQYTPYPIENKNLGMNDTSMKETWASNHIKQ